MAIEVEVKRIIKPPIGLKPRRIVTEERIEEIKAAMCRYMDVDKPIPIEWLEEYNEILNIKKPDGPGELDEYLESLTWVDKVLYIIKMKNKFVFTKQIAEELYKYYPDKNKDQIHRYVSSNLQKLKLAGKVINTKINMDDKNRKYVQWGLKIWSDKKPEL